MMEFVTYSAMMLKNAGYSVTPAEEGIPGLWNVEGLARDVTTGQLHDLARQYGFLQVFPEFLRKGSSV